MITKVVRSFCLGVLLAQPLLAMDWPRWGGPDGDGRAPDGALAPERLAGELKTIWRAPIGNGLGSPVVSGDKVFYLDNQQNQETLHAAEAASGKAIWNVPIDEVFKDTQSAPGPRGTPLVDGDFVYANSCQGEFKCLRVADGGLVWKTSFTRDFHAYFLGERGDAPGASRHGYTGSPTIEGERMYVNVGGTNGASVVCFNKRNGQVIWQSQNDIPGHASPRVATLAGVKQVVSFTAEAVIGLAAEDGRLLWRIPVQTRLGRHAVTPVIAGDFIVVSSHQAGLIGIQVTANQGAIRAERVWLNKPLAINFSSPVAADGCLYGLGPGRKLVCVDLRTGEKTWEQEDAFAGAMDKDYAAFIVLKDRILGLGYNGRLALFAVDRQAYRSLGDAKVCGDTWCNPAYADGRLFLRDERELLCVRLAP
jgi:outer membrane protein assembly factor BamB